MGGDLSIDEPWSLRELPAGLSVKGNLNLLTFPCSQNISLGCQVGGNLDGNGYMKTGRGGTDGRQCAVERTTDSFWVGGDVDLAHAGRLKYMRGFVGGNLNLDHSSVGTLDNDLEVGGNLSAKDCDGLSKVGCRVGGMTDVSGRRIARMGRKPRTPTTSKGKGLAVKKAGCELRVRRETLGGK